MKDTRKNLKIDQGIYEILHSLKKPEETTNAELLRIIKESLNK